MDKMKMNRCFGVFIFLLSCLSGHGQGNLDYEYLTTSCCKDKAGDKHGSGNMMRFSGRYTLPISRSVNDKQQLRVWNATLSASYHLLDNQGEAAALNPDKVLNTNLTVSHMRTLSKRWSLFASLGCGVYAAPDDIRWRSLLANGSFIFTYRLLDNLSVGIGGGVTNSYGLPMLLPMGYLTWKTSGAYELTVDVANAPKIKVAKQIGRATKVKLTAIEMDGMSAVMLIDGKEKLYSCTMLKSNLGASFRMGGKTSVCVSIGGVWLRKCQLTDRNLKSFFKSIGSNENKYHFGPSLRCSVGLRYGF